MEQVQGLGVLGFGVLGLSFSLTAFTACSEALTLTAAFSALKPRTILGAGLLHFKLFGRISSPYGTESIHFVLMNSRTKQWSMYPKRSI